MPTSTPRHRLLQLRVKELALALDQVDPGSARSLGALRVAAWRFREWLPVLQVEPSSGRKLSRRLRRLARRFRKVRTLGAQLRLVDAVADIDRTSRQASTRMRNDLRRGLTGTRLATARKKARNDLKRMLHIVEGVADELPKRPDASSIGRDMRWAVKARVARRAATLRRAADAAGAVYVPGRLSPVRRTVRGLRFALELLSELTGGVPAGDLQVLAQTHDALEELRDAERLIRRIRAVQAALTPPDAKPWQEMDALVATVENRCRRLHGRYMRERTALAALAGRFAARVAPAVAKRKAG